LYAGADEGLAQVDATFELEVVFADGERRLFGGGAADRFGERQRFAAQCLAEFLRAGFVAGVRGHVAGCALKKQARRTGLLLDQRGQRSRIVSGELAHFAILHRRVGGEVNGVGDGFTVGIFYAQHEEFRVRGFVVAL
jgi:hypothetical protein